MFLQEDSQGKGPSEEIIEEVDWKEGCVVLRATGYEANEESQEVGGAESFPNDVARGRPKTETGRQDAQASRPIREVTAPEMTQQG